MAKNRIKVYWLLLITLLYTAGMVFSVGEAQARYENTVVEDTVVEFSSAGITSNCLVTEQQLPVRVILGEMSLWRSTEATFWLYSAQEDVEGAVAWGLVDEDQGDYVNLSMRSGADVLEPYAEVDILKGVKMDLTLVITPTDIARKTAHPAMEIDVLVTWGEEMWGQFRVVLPEVEEETEPTDPSDPTAGEEDPETETADIADDDPAEPTDPDDDRIRDDTETASAAAEEEDPLEEETGRSVDGSEPVAETGDENPVNAVDLVAEADAKTLENGSASANPTGEADAEEPDENSGADSADAANEEKTENGEGTHEEDPEDPEGSGSTENTNDDLPEGGEGTIPESGTQAGAPENENGTDPVEDPEGDPPDSGESITPDAGEAREPDEESGDPAVQQERYKPETLERFDSSGVLPIRVPLTEEVTMVRVGLCAGDEEDGESTEIALLPFPAFTKSTYSYNDVKGFDMMYGAAVVEFDLRGAPEAEILEQEEELLELEEEPSDDLTGKDEFLVLLDFTQTSLAEEQEVALAVEILAGDTLLESHKLTATSDARESLVAAVLTKAELEAKYKALEEGEDLPQDAEYTRSGHILNQGQALDVCLPMAWQKAEMDYSLELLTMTDSSILLYRPVNLGTGCWDVEYINDKDGKAHNLVVQLGSVLPQAGTYRLTMKWNYEGVCYTQTQMTFFINYSGSIQTVLGS